MKPAFPVLLAALVSMPFHTVDRCDRALRRLEGWTISSATSISGAFEGCDFGKIIKFADGTSLKCSTYSYSYSYAPDVIIFRKSTSIEGKDYSMVKMMVDGEVYDMSSVAR
jgi:hypothetical protein